MLFEKIIEIIELTDTDTISEALETFNKHGIVASTAFPYLNEVFARAPQQLCNKFKQIGFKGAVNITEISTDGQRNCYAVYDSHKHNENDAHSWLMK